ncbi:hypothetical protein VMCG_00843 [Cytospora schulzeri]|uniref:DUF2293 domain-containing protein n=1 Tax=Cytospora schulzeri TaxID=448051 RepID=A0A423X946_9PEZI|nr:hypothetical protein VMCG_00843 [Valsa malicola]
MDEPSVTRASLPKGYSFVPKGNVFITGKCRRHTQAASRIVYVVFKDGDKKKQIGIGVPTNIYLQVQLDERNTRAERASNVLKRDENTAKEFEKAIIKEFQHIPARDVSGVLVKALEKGKGKVGRTSTLDISKKAILAVRAYIRHQHTNYDMLLRGGMGRDEARKEVAAKVRDIDRIWKRTGSRVQGRKATIQQLPEPTVAGHTSTFPKSTPNLAGQVQTDMPKPRSIDRQLTNPLACNPLSTVPDATDQSKNDAASVDLALQKLGEIRRRKILDSVAQVQGHERKLRTLSGRQFRRDKSRRNSILFLKKTVNKLLEEVGMQRVETSGAMDDLTKQLRLIAPDPTVEPQVPSPGTNSNHQVKTIRASAHDQLAVEREGKSEDAEIQGEPPKKTRLFIDLTGDSDENDVASVQTSTATQQKHHKKTVRGHMVSGRRISDATAREIQRELRELGVEDTGQVLPPKRRAAVEADRVLSRRFHSRKA